MPRALSGVSLPLLLALHGGYLLAARPQRDLSATAVGWSVVSLLLGFWTLNLATQSRPRVRALASLGYLLAYGALASYAASAADSFDYAVLRDNFSLLLYPGSGAVVLRAFDPKILLAAAIAGAVMLAAGRKRWLVAGARLPGQPRWKLVACALGYVGFVLAPQPSADPLMGFVQSVYRYYELELRSYAAARGESAYPLIRTDSGIVGRLDMARAPHVFVVMIESFNAKYVEARTEDGRPYTPVFDQLIPRGWYVERFYGNSVQTVKGQFATLLSVIPSVNGRKSATYIFNRYYSLVQALRDRGYRTLFFQGYPDLDFDGTAGFIGRIGFDEGRSAAEFLEPEDQAYVWGWGPEDHVVYRRFFELLDAKLERNAGPVFAAIATISNHVPFEVPAKRRLIYPKPGSVHERYANSLHLSDRALAVFFAELERRPALRNSLVVITGDHSYPTGDHGIERSELGYYEESFRTPLLILWPGRLEPRRIPGPHSQLDLAPTLLDLVGAPVARNHFQGRSLLAAGSPPAVYLVQPYNGAWLGVVDYPFKYLRRLHYGEELLFDLAADPREERSLIPGFPDQQRLSELRKGVERILLTHHLVRRDRVWDGQGAEIRARPLADILLIGHRGNSGAAPENTLAAIDEAFDLGAQVVEVDVRLSRDGIPVVIHDDTVDRTTDGSGRVRDLTLDHLKTLDAGSWKHTRYAAARIPTLAEALRRAAGRGRLLIDPKVEGLGRSVAEALRLAGVPSESAVVGSWNRKQERDFASHLPGAVILQTGRAPARWGPHYFSEARRRGVSGFELSGPWPVEFIIEAHAHAMPVYAYTVNDEPTMRRLLDLGVDGIETDELERALEVFGGRP